jgi:thiol-disulfide isomerase/thioredoxin
MRVREAGDVGTVKHIVSACGLIAVLAPAHVARAVDTAHLEGHPAPRLETRLHIGSRVPGLDELKGRVVLLFFWAHWCPECKAESPTIGKLLERYRSQGLTIVAPTQRYGYVGAGRPATPDKELRYIIQVRDTYYGFLRDAPVPLSDANAKSYGVTDMPTHVLLDRKGIVRLVQPGRMTEDELEAAIQKLLLMRAMLPRAFVLSGAP